MVLDRLIQNTKDTKHSLFKASGVWLFSFVQYCSHVTEVHQRLREAQASFMRLLSARDDMVQETASRGLTLVYEKGDEALRTQLHYRFDPNPNVQRSMNNIWKATVKEPTAILNQHFDLIMEDLLKNIVGKEWRAREASCSAISDLIQGRKYSQYERYYSTLWVVSLKVIDDAKGSVRKAALDLSMVLSKTLVHTLESSSENTSTKAMMGQALEFLLSDKLSGKTTR
ncbi:Proteasome component ECM29 [Ceratocystis platani]|uniref:Proteasome component ECM29 n=1 Tax=Ceratocystis fimbriata f. sp. platani TaxID=88771 RepID=A0A0F8BIS1_CERFI|nr:Proteasome component ECM29 [Ceratocystis platani]